jgi:heme a synthase
MEIGAQPLARLRGYSLSPEGVRRLTFATVAALVAIVATGATVRLTGSGLGCEHWPGCEPHHFEPRSFHAYIEFGNRMFSAVTIALTAATAWFLRRRLTVAVFVGTLMQAPLGALTVHFHLNPYLVLSHFLLSATVLTLAVVVAAETRERVPTQLPAWVPRAGLVVAASGLVLIVSGTLATASGPHPGSTVVRRLWSFEPAVYWHVRATAVFGIAFALVLAYLWRRGARQLGGGLLVLALLALQMSIGEIQYRTHLPWWLVLVHVTVAVTVWAALTSFVYSLWRPRTLDR